MGSRASTLDDDNNNDDNIERNNNDTYNVIYVHTDVYIYIYI